MSASEESSHEFSAAEDGPSEAPSSSGDEEIFNPRTKFGQALSAILNEDLPEDAPLEAPILGKRKLKRQIDPETLERRRLKRLRKQRQAALTQFHVVPQFDHTELRLMRIAKRGVVTLFNAVATQQRERKLWIEEAQESGKKLRTSQIEARSQEALKQRLTTRAAAVSSSAGRGSSVSIRASAEMEDDHDGDDDDDDDDDNDAAAPDFLRDDYMLKAHRLKDWDEPDTSDSEDGTTAAAGDGDDGDDSDSSD